MVKQGFLFIRHGRWMWRFRACKAGQVAYVGWAVQGVRRVARYAVWAVQSVGQIACYVVWAVQHVKRAANYAVWITAYLAFLGVVVLCGGCVGFERMAAMKNHAQQIQTRNAMQRYAFMQSGSDRQAQHRAQEVNKPWLAGRASPLAREVTLPTALRQNIDTTLMFAGGATDLMTLSERITRATGIAVRVRPDALLPAELFLPRLAVSAPTAGTPLPLQAMLPRGAQPLPSVLDTLAWRLGVYWRYSQDAIEFYRTETQVFNVRALTLNARADARLGRVGASGSAGFESTSNTTLSIGEQDAMAAIQARIEPFLSRAGTITAVSGAVGSVVITDTRDVLERVKRFLDQENKILTRRVRLVFEEITVVTKDNVQGSIDWNVVYEGVRAATSSALGSDAQASRVSVPLGGGAFQGTKAILAALSEIGTIVRHSSVPVLTLNRRPVTHAIRTTFSYVDQVQGITASGQASEDSLAKGGLPSVSVSQKQETVGSFLTVAPDAQENGQILLSIAYDNTVAQPLKSLTFGKQGNRLEIQQITVEGNGMVQQVALQAGQPMIISGFERYEDAYDRRRLSPHAPLVVGGSDRASTQHATTVILVTAQVEEGL